MWWRKTKLVPIIKHGKDNSEDVTTFHPISLINTCKRVLKLLFMNRINQLLFSHNYMNKT